MCLPSKPSFQLFHGGGFVPFMFCNESCGLNSQYAIVEVLASVKLKMQLENAVFSSLHV